MNRFIRPLAALGAAVALAGCGAAHAAASAPHRPPAPDYVPPSTAAAYGTPATAQPNWTGTTPVLSWSCSMGYANTMDGRTPTTNGVYAGGPPPASDPYQPQPAYRLSAANTGPSPVTVATLTAVFYDASGAEVTQDTESPGTLIMPGQGITWTFLFGQGGDRIPSSCGIGTWGSQ